MARLKHPLTIAIDTGGTFTDCVYRRGGRVEVLKLASTPDDPGRAILDAVERIVAGESAGADIRNGIAVRHGTTVATNALLERKGARVAFVTTAGFEDTLALGRQARPSLYDWNEHRRAPLADAEMCFGLRERVGPDGAVLLCLEATELDRLREWIVASDAESVAVSLLFGFANPEHERRVAEGLGDLGLPVSLSHQILPEFREFERGSTVTLNAYLAPRMAGYLEALEAALSRRGAGLSIMQSSGGVLPAMVAAREPVRTILSGPAGGVMGALTVARAAGLERVLTFDMGGTSTDVALLETGIPPQISTEGQVAGLPVGVPMLDIHTAGAGGGSLAWFDLGGALQAGPQSAGAVPGPACYGRSDDLRATVTDADLVLGRLHSDHFLGGAMRLDVERARAALERVLQVSPEGFATVEEFAAGVVRVANARMESALRRVSVERGQDPKSFALLAFGGAGPLHGCALAEALGIRQVLIPNAPGALSALGILDADLSREFSRTVMLVPESGAIDERFGQLEAEARAAFAGMGDMPKMLRSADLRYRGQGYELRVEWGPDAGLGAVARFHRLHERSYGYSDLERTVEVVTLRVQAVIATVTPDRRPREAAKTLGRTAKKQSAGKGKQAFLGAHRMYESGRWRRGALYDRARLEPGDSLLGPAVIVELSATTYLPQGWRATVDGFSNLVLMPEGARG